MTSPATDIPVLIQQELGELRTLENLLVQEHAAIVANDLNGLSGLLEQKLDTSQQLSRTEQAIHTALSALGLSLDNDGMKSYLAQLPPSEKSKNTLSSWQQVCDLANACREKNVVNGRIIDANKQAAEELLRILKGQKPEDKNSYGPSGHAVSSTDSITLAKA